jgi:hypothetical protein
VAVLLSAGVGLAESPSGSQQPRSSDKDPSVAVMTRNVYRGVDAELNRVATASSVPAFLDATAAVYNGYHERNFPEGAASVAAEIEDSQPDVVGLQEAVMVRKDTPADGTASPAEEVSLDHLHPDRPEDEDRGAEGSGLQRGQRPQTGGLGAQAGVT